MLGTLCPQPRQDTLYPIAKVQSVPMSDDLSNPPGPDSSVHERIKWIRERRGHPSPRAAATTLGLPLETLRKHESGQRGKDGLKDHHIKRYARAFKVNSFWLQTGKGSPTAIDASEITPDELRIIEALRATRGAA
jgi:hypothetical protein